MHHRVCQGLYSPFPPKNRTIGSLEWDGANIRVANVTTGSGSINTINPNTGAQIGSIRAPAGRGEGLAFDGVNLYYSIVNRIYVIHPVTGAIIRSVPAPGGNCRALAYGLGFLFCGNSATGVVTIVDRITFANRGSFLVPGGGTEKIEGLAFNPTTRELFIANQSENTIHVGRVTI